MNENISVRIKQRQLSENTDTFAQIFILLRHFMIYYPMNHLHHLTVVPLEKHPQDLQSLIPL